MVCLVYYHAHDGTVQLHMVDLERGSSSRLIDASADDTQWRPWCTDSGRSVLDHRSALDPQIGRVIYLDGQEVRSVDVPTGRDRLLFVLPEGRDRAELRDTGCRVVRVHPSRLGEV